MASEASTAAAHSLGDVATSALLPSASAASPDAVAAARSRARAAAYVICNPTAAAGEPDGSALSAAHSGVEEGSRSEGAGEEEGGEWEEEGEDESGEDYGDESDDSEESEGTRYFRALAKVKGEDMEEYDRQIARDKARARARRRMVEAMLTGYGRAAEAVPAYVLPSDPSVIVRVPPTSTRLPLDDDE